MAWPEEHIPRRKWHETAWLLLLPPLITGILTVALGIFPDAEISPLTWARFIADVEYLALPK